MRSTTLIGIIIIFFATYASIAFCMVLSEKYDKYIATNYDHYLHQIGMLSMWTVVSIFVLIISCVIAYQEYKLNKSLTNPK